MSLAFGSAAALLTRPSASHWIGLIGTVTYFVSGLIISEVIFGWATEEDLQPNIDGLSFDEMLLFGLVPGVVVVVGAWLLTRHARAGTTAA